MERYEEEDGRYVLYVGGMRVAATERVALIVDAERGRLVTHGDPHSVRSELDALTRALHGHVNIHELHLAFTQTSAQRLTGELIARLRQRRMT